MDLKELGISVIEILIASMPMLITLLATFNAKNERINKNITTFNVDNKKTSEKLSKLIDENFKKIVNDNNNFNMITVARVDTFLENSNKTLDNFVKEINDLKLLNELSLNVSKNFMEMLTCLIEEDVDKLRNGIYDNINAKYNMTKEELQKYPKLLERDYDLLKDTMKKTMSNIGIDNFKTLLEEIGYEEREEGKKLQTKK